MTLLSAARGMFRRASGRHPLELVKYLEIKLLGRYASTYCFHHPSHALIELTTRCNLRCQWCNQSDPKWQKEFGHKDMPFELVEKIIPQLKGSRVLLLYNIGEPLLYKRVLDAIRLARRYIPEVRLTTNGLLLTPEKAVALQDAGLTQLNVSIDSPDPKLMKELRGGTDLHKVEANLLQFSEVCPIPVETWSVISEANVDSLAKLPEWASRIPSVRRLYFQLQNGVETGQEAGYPPLGSRERFEGLKADVGKACRELGLRTNIESLPFYPMGFHKRAAKGICQAPFNQLMAINVDGHLAPCCSYATQGLGDVAGEGFPAVWNGHEMRAWRSDMLNQRYGSYCSGWCGYREAAKPTSLVVKFTPE